MNYEMVQIGHFLPTIATKYGSYMYCQNEGHEGS